MNESIFEEKKIVSLIIKFLLYLFKWFSLIVFVLTAGLTVCLLLSYIVQGANLSSTIISSMFSYLTDYTEVEAQAAIEAVGKLKVVVAGCGFGFAQSLTYCLIYVVMMRLIMVFDNITVEKIFTRENVKLINQSLPLTFFIAFTTPIIIICIKASTTLLSTNNIDLSGVIYIAVFYILKLLINEGYDLEKKSKRQEKKISDYNIQVTEEKMASIKKAEEPKNVKAKKNNKKDREK